MRRIELILTELVKKACRNAEEEAEDIIEFGDVTPSHYQAQYDTFKTIVHTETVESVMNASKNKPQE